MRKIQKKQAENFLQLLGQAHHEIKKALETKKYDTARELLEQCQDGAIELGNMIEEQEGEGFVTVSLLEEYCELVYRIHEEIWQDRAFNLKPNKIDKRLKKQLIAIENSVKNDIPVKIEAVFLPYKASMWDSLESVWKAAEEAPNCTAYVIPIPYYDRNPDGSFREMHDERNLYPDYVPITDYESFDFAVHCPDMIFIHNPYDENNYVTSVHPFFYSSNLKKYTENLIYLPYFILGDVDLDNENALKGMAHFVTTPGVVNADKVIVQSENMRQAYIKVMVMVTGEHTREYWEKKILGLGSPKVDKVLSTRKEDIEVPEEWRKVIEREDGSWKKVIFYNTSLQALLNHNEKMNTKIREVLRIFKENQEEVALLWRPHPLIEATIKSVRPRLWEEYKEIVENYKLEGWGIYDDSVDLDRAITLCDAYYGDWSSVAHLCQKKKKPVMYQNVNSLIENNYSLAMDNMVEYEGEWWFLAMKDNGIYKMKKESLEATLVKRIPYSNVYNAEHPEYGKIHIYRDKVFIIPMLTKYIAIYDIKSDELRYIECENVDLNRGTVFWDGIEYEDKLYLIPCGYECILYIDLITEKTGKIEINDVTSDYQFDLPYAWGSVLQNDKKVIFTNLFKNVLIAVDLKTGNKEIFEFAMLDGGGSGICGDENSIWIIPRKTDKIFCWDKNSEQLKIYDQFPTGYEAGDWSFYKMCMGSELFLLPRDANMCIAVDKKSGTMRNLMFHQGIDDEGNLLNRYMYCTNIWECENKIIIITSDKGEIISFLDNNSVQKEKIKICQSSEEKQMFPDVMGEQKNRFGDIKHYMRNVVKDIFTVEEKGNIGTYILKKCISI